MVLVASLGFIRRLLHKLLFIRRLLKSSETFVHPTLVANLYKLILHLLRKFLKFQKIAEFQKLTEFQKKIAGIAKKITNFQKIARISKIAQISENFVALKELQYFQKLPEFSGAKNGPIF